MNNENFNDIFEKYRRISTRTAYRIVKDRGIAEDISQEVFCNLYRMGTRLDMSNEHKVRSLILTASVNKAKDYLKKAYVKHEITTMDTIMAEEIRDSSYNVEAAMLTMEAEKFQQMVLQRLRYENRMNYDIMVKVKLMDIPPEIVAEEYGISRNNVNNRIYRTRLWVEKEMSKFYK